LKNGELHCFEKSYIGDYEIYIKYIDVAKKRNKLKESSFFNEILKYNQRIKFKDDEEAALKETEKSFQKLQIILKSDGLLEMDKDILRLCLNPFKENVQKIKDELKILGEIFKVKVRIENIYEGILLFSKRKFIHDAASSIFTFINTIEPIKTDFIKNIKEISI
jgi:hypothetical protein